MIAIAVHNDDAMTVAEYDKGLRFATFPNGIINRKYQCQPMDDSGNNYSFEGKTTFLNMFQQAIQETPFIEPRILQAQITDNIIKVKSEVKFALNPRSNHYRVIYVITENDVETKATQHNYLSPYNLPIFGEFGKGGKFGTSVIKGYKFQEVARGIYPSFNGADGMLPANINSSQTYPLEYEIALSDATINNMEKLDVTIMITDENSGEILNADQIKVTR